LKDILGMMADRGLVPGQLTIGDCIELAQAAQARVSDVVVIEAAAVNQMTKQEVLSAVLDSFAHNLCAVEIGHTTGSSFLMGTAGKELVGEGKVQIVEDGFLNRVLAYTLSAQVGNHRLTDAVLVVTLEPCIMCLGAVIQARLAGVVFAAADPKAGCLVSRLEGTALPWSNHHFWTLGGILEAECSAKLSSFFQQRRLEKKISKNLAER